MAKSISLDEQENLMNSFWSMLKECESKADNDNDVVLKHWVEQWYQQWNRIQGGDQIPRWKKNKPWEKHNI